MATWIILNALPPVVKVVIVLPSKITMLVPALNVPELVKFPEQFIVKLFAVRVPAVMLISPFTSRISFKVNAAETLLRVRPFIEISVPA